MQRPDELRLTWDQNPAVAEVTRDLKPGDSMTLELRLTVKSQDAEGVLFTVEAAVPDGYEVAPAEKAAQSAAPAESLMTPTAAMVRRMGRRPMVAPR